MPDAIPTRLNCHTFFKFWSFQAFGKYQNHLSKKDRIIAQIAAIVFGACTLGIGISLCKEFSRKYIYLPTDYDRVQRIYNRRVERRPQANEDLLEHLKSSYQTEGFCKFRQRYDELKAIMNQEGFPNPVYLKDYLVDDDVKYLALASDFLDAICKYPVRWDVHLPPILKELNFDDPELYSLFLKEIAAHSSIEFVPYILSLLDFENSSLSSITFLEYIIQHTERAKWETGLPFLWEMTFQIERSALGKTTFLRKIIRSLSTPKKFQVAFESLIAFEKEFKKWTPEQLLHDGISLPLSKKMKIVKNTLWDKKPFRKDVAQVIASSQTNFFAAIRNSLATIPQNTEPCLNFLGIPSCLTLPEGPIDQILENLNVLSWTALCLVSKGHYQHFFIEIKRMLSSQINEILNPKSPISLASIPLENLLELRNSVELLMFEKALFDFKKG